VIIDGVLIGNRIYWTLTLVITNNYVSLTELNTTKITVTTTHIKPSQSSLAVAWQRLPTADVTLPLGFRTVLGLGYQILTSHNCNSQPTELTQPQLGRSVKLLLVFVSTVISGFSLLEIHDQDFYSLLDIFVFRNGISSSMKVGSVFLCRLYVCCAALSARVYPCRHGVSVGMHSVNPLSLQYTK
jgi:hypothetical protein